MKPIFVISLITVLAGCGSNGSDGTSNGEQPQANRAPVAAFQFNCNALNCQFDASQSRDDDGAISSTHWSFGDGSNGESTSMQHQYQSSGDYNVTLTITDDDGANATETKLVSVTIEQTQVTPVETVFNNAHLYGFADAGAVAVDQGKIVAIGSNSQIQAYIDSDTQVIDLNGKWLLPGFIDNHNHLGEGGEVTCEPQNNLSLADQAGFLQRCAAGVPADTWIIGYGGDFYIEMEDSTDPRTTVQLLDDLFPQNPVIIMDFTSHAMFVNSLAYEKAGITAQTPDPQGGIFMKDNNGRLNGMLMDNAGDVVMEIAVNSIEGKFDIIDEGIRYGLQAVAENGITTVGDGRTYWKRGMFEGWQRVHQAGDMTARVSVRPWIYPEVDDDEQLQFLQGALQNDIEQLLIVNQVKMYIDGMPELGSGRVIEPYLFTYFQQYPNGYNYIDESRMTGLLKDLQTIGYGAHIHAIGDLGVRETLNAIEAVRANNSDLQYNMTHLHMMDPADLNRFAQLQVDADLQVGAFEGGNMAGELGEHLHPFIGKERADEILHTPVKALYQSNANVVLSSDWTVNPLSPMAAISVVVAEQAMPIHAAIDAYTINAAKALGLESITGSIEVGKSADFVVLDRDLTTSTPAQIRNAQVLRTVLQGETVYSR